MAAIVLLHGMLVLRGLKSSDWRDQLGRWGSALMVASIGLGLVTDTGLIGRGPDVEVWVAALGALLVVQGLLNFLWGKPVRPAPKTS
jgi:branched-subunit amino acid ABC-type transport system permease component